MSVLSSKALHEQLSVIMGALTKAAVAEICEVVDEGYAVLQMEISRSHKENDDLRKKLHLIESIVVRGSGGGKAVGAAAEPGVVEIQEQPETKPPPPQHQQREDDGGDTATAGGGDGGEAVVVPEEFPDVVLIKDEDSDSNDVYEDDKKTTTDSGSGASTPISRRTKRPWSGPEDALSQSVKSSPSEPLPMRSPPSRLSAGTPKKTLSSVYALDSPHSEPVCNELDAAESACSYSSQMDPDLHVVHQDCSLLSNRPPPYFSGTLMESQSPSSRAELDLSLTWTKQAKTQTPFTHFHQSENMDTDAFGLKLVSVSGSTSADCQLSESSNSAFDYDEADMVNFGLYRDQTGQLCNGRPGSGSKSRRFMCSICKKTYATSQNLDVHMRIHTGERPFSCDQCGKKFTQSAHLKSHLSVHTGERPYACSICSRSFIVQYSLKLHMKKCHPNV